MSPQVQFSQMYLLNKCGGQKGRKDRNDWMRKCTDYEVDGVKTGGRPKRTWSKMVEENAVNCTKWKRLRRITACIHDNGE